MTKQKAAKLVNYFRPDVFVMIGPPHHGPARHISHFKDDFEVIGTLDFPTFMERLSTDRPYPTEDEIMELVQPLD